MFSERFRLRNNWLGGRCNVRTFEGHTQGVSCVQFDDTRIVSGSSDKTIKVNISPNPPPPITHLPPITPRACRAYRTTIQESSASGAPITPSMCPEIYTLGNPTCSWLVGLVCRVLQWSTTCCCLTCCQIVLVCGFLYSLKLQQKNYTGSRLYRIQLHRVDSFVPKSLTALLTRPVTIAMVTGVQRMQRRGIIAESLVCFLVEDLIWSNCIRETWSLVPTGNFFCLTLVIVSVCLKYLRFCLHLHLRVISWMVIWSILEKDKYLWFLCVSLN